MMSDARVCVIGAGSSGLIAAKNLVEAGFEVDVLERAGDLGGNWNYGMPYARVYASTRMISSKPFTQIPDYPMPAAFPDYPHHSEVLAYLRGYAEHFGVQSCIRFDTPVVKVTPCAQGWDVTVGAGEVRRYGAVVIANGHNWLPKQPSYPGNFTGTTMHSADYKEPSSFRGKRVLVVGGGNSGCDIAVEAADQAALTLHSVRRGYHYIPRYLFGRPADQMGDALLNLRLPLALRRLITSLALRAGRGSQTAFGLPRPDHRLYETHPIVNEMLPEYVRQRRITVKPDVARFDGRSAHFTDGTAAEIDTVVFATGYRIEIPFIDQALLHWRDGRPHLYLNVFAAGHDTLFTAGLIQPDSGQFGLVHWQTRAIAMFLRAMHRGEPGAARLRERIAIGTSDLGSGIHYAESTRHFLEVEHWSYRKRLLATLELLSGECTLPASR